MNLVELELDETLADFEIQDWIDNVFSVQYPDVKARIKNGCSGHCQKKNEWHYVENGDLPKKSISVLAYFKVEDVSLEYVSLVECLYIPDEGFKHPIFSEWYEPTAWIEKEKILPKEHESC